MAMIRSVKVALSKNPYEVHIGDHLLEGCGTAIRKACGGGNRCALVTDSNVGPLYGSTLQSSLEEAGAKVTRIEVPAGEASKAFSKVEVVCEAMVEAGLDRNAFLVALGGGVVGDLAGFAAAIFYRGIPYAQVPTTLLAQVDSSVGGKTGINTRGGKNLVGSFHQPKIVIADTNTLASLSERTFNEGMSEAIKHGIIRDAGLVSDARRLADDDRTNLVARNVAIKAAIVAEDEFETSGVRALLNFGHTVGHAIEQAAGYGTFLHGEAISMGIVAALRLSVKKAGLPAGQAEAAINSLKAFSLPVALPPGFPKASLLAAMRRDKKFREGKIRFVLTRSIGSAFLSEDVTEEDISRILDDLDSLNFKIGCI